jgi:hypothetical protein
MTKTMADLRTKVAKRLRETLHGREIDTLEMGMPETAHMLGIVPIGGISTREAEKGTLLDCDHDFWNDYDKTVSTRRAAMNEVKSAIRLLRENETFTVNAPYGEEAGIMYCEVEPVERDGLATECAECGAALKAEPKMDSAIGGLGADYTLSL